MKIGLNIRELSNEELTYAKQVGAEGVYCSARLTPTCAAQGYATPEELAPLKQKVESHGLELFCIYIHPYRTAEIARGTPGRDQEIENIARTIRAASAVGIPTVIYEHTVWRTYPKPWSQLASAPKPTVDDVRVCDGPGRYYRAIGRGEAVILTHDSARARDDARRASEEDNAPYGQISAEELWERMRYFYRAIIPVAEDAGVNFGCHPDDPPEKTYRGVEQILNSVEGLKKLVDLVPSRRNGLLLCLGTLHEMGQDTMGAIEYFLQRGKIFQAHFRNPKGTVASGYYQEEFLDEGDLDMLSVMRLFQKHNYQGTLNPDHAVGMIGDDQRGRMAFAWEVGYMKALRAAVQAS